MVTPGSTIGVNASSTSAARRPALRMAAKPSAPWVLMLRSMTCAPPGVDTDDLTRSLNSGDGRRPQRAHPPAPI